MIRRKLHGFLAAAAVCVTALPAFAGGAPTMDAVTLPIDEASVVTAIATVGATILLAVFGVSIGFYLIRKLFHSIKRAI